MAVRPVAVGRVGQAELKNVPHFNGCGGWYLAACVVPVQIVKDVMIMPSWVVKLQAQQSSI